MSIKDIKLRKGMSRDKVNELIGEYGKLHDEIYLGNSYSHDWVCGCGDIIKSKRWSTVREYGLIKCDKCKYNEIEQRYKYEVEKTGEYEYIRSFRKGDALPNGRIVGDNPYIQIKHNFCKSIYEITANNFINQHQKCSKCCGSYENSFAYYIEQELREPLDKYWDFEKNTVNPYHICKNVTKEKVWIKCNKITYHESFEITLANFIKGSKKSTFGCPYCHGRKTHPKDSFAQHHIDNTDKDFLTKYWSDKNTVDPFSIAPNSSKKVWIKCQEKDYHNDHGGYEIVCSSFTSGKRCSYCGNHKVHPKDSFAQYCLYNIDKDFLTKHWSDKNTVDPWSIKPNSAKKVWIKCQDKDYHDDYTVMAFQFTKGTRCTYCHGGKNVHPLDSFGYHNFDKVQSWHPDNDISPFKVAPNSGKKYKFICPDCGHVWEAHLNNISNGKWCPQCSASKGEKEISKWLRLNNINFISQKEFDGLLGVRGGNLSYDFYLPDCNLLIEYQGKQHERYIRGFHENKNDFKRQQEHDKRKREYAKGNNIELLEIWYWDFDNIDEILNKQIKCKINLNDVKNIA